MSRIDVGSVVICVNNTLSDLRQGETYIVQEVMRGGRNIVVQGDPTSYLIDRFILAPVKQTFKQGERAVFEGNLRDFTINKSYHIHEINEQGLLYLANDCGIGAFRNPDCFRREGDRTPIKWKLVRTEYMRAIKEILGVSESNMTISYIYKDDTEYIDKLSQAGVLRIWFEPQYEAEMKQVKAGDQGVTVEIKAGSSTMTVIGMKGDFDINQLRNVISWAEGKVGISCLGSWDIRLKVSSTDRCFRLGCKDSAYFFSLWEMRLIKSEWDKLNS